MPIESWYWQFTSHYDTTIGHLSTPVVDNRYKTYFGLNLENLDFPYVGKWKQQ